MTGILKEIKLIVDHLNSMQGDFHVHLSVLKDKIINKDRILKNDNLTEPQKIIKKFVSLLDKITSDSTVKNIDAAFFSNHLKNIISNIEQEETISQTHFNLQISNMLNLKHYNYVFFMGLENNKYPRKHDKIFPFTPEVNQIIKSLGVNSYDIDIYENNLLMEKYFFRGSAKSIVL